jgi:Ca2+-transporting ATPase
MVLMDQQPLDYYRLNPAEVLHSLRSDSAGLKVDDAKRRLESDGSNELQPVKHPWAGFIFLRQFKNLLVAILLLSAVFSIYLQDFKTATILIFISLVNVLVGYFQEYKAERLSEGLEHLVKAKAKVIRSSKLQEINSSELVVGDIVYVESGDSVPADLRIIEEQELSTNDFALTGESSPARKFVHAMSGEVPLAARHNLIFMGTTVATGSGHGVVIGCGMQTELGRIANLSQATDTGSSPLQREMGHLAIRLTQGTAILAAILTIIALRSHLGLRAALLFAIGISAAMIPNGLAAEVNITLAQTAGRMAKAKALVKRLSAVETLGATTIICTDKTGTLTKNEMTAKLIRIGKQTYHVTGSGYDPASGFITWDKHMPLSLSALSKLELFFTTIALASNARVEPPDSEHATWYCVGDPTEGALISLARKAHIDPDKLDELYPEIKEFQFDSARKRMSSVRHYDGQTMVFTKGAPENVLERCTHIWDNGKVRKLTQKDRISLLSTYEEEARQAKRNLGIAYRVLPKGKRPKTMQFDEVEQQLIWLGMVSIIDPLRDEVPNAMKAARAAHVKVSIVTGDYPTTAKAIARQANLVQTDQELTVILGDQLNHLSDSQLTQLLEHGGVVFSRVAPEDKMRLVGLARAHGQVVAVTGDGINDAPALKQADIGVAMGKTGTDIAKQAADIVLLDDSFNTLVGAIEQGRLTYRNITKAARSALTTNAAELGAVLIGLACQIAFHIPIAITAIQILAIDVIAQIFPVTALGWDPAQRELMKEKPRNLRNHIINRRAVGGFLCYGLLSAALAYGNFLLFFARRHMSPVYMNTGSEVYQQATILTYVTIVLCQFVNLLIIRTDEREPFFSKYLWSNKKLLLAFGVSFLCILNIMYNPYVRPYFSAGPLSIGDWGMALLAGAIYLSICLLRRYDKKHTRRAIVELHREKLRTQAAGTVRGAA